jgi:inner membrane protein
MDPVTHGLTGVALSNLFPKKKATFTVLLVASLAPDFDYITRIWGVDAFLRYHRGITHGIIALFVIPLLLGIFANWRVGKNFLYYIFISFVGYGTHLVMDLTNQYPTRILSPLDWSQYSLDLTFIIDPYVVGGLILCIILTAKKSARKRTITAIILLCMVMYMSTRFYLKNRTEDFLRTQLDEYHYRLSPLPNDFSRWWFSTHSDDTYKVGFVDLLTRSVCVQREFLYSEDEPEIRESKQLKTVKNFLYFARSPLPLIERKDDETIVTWLELSYFFIPGDHFIARVRFDDLGRAVEEYFRF